MLKRLLVLMFGLLMLSACDRLPIGGANQGALQVTSNQEYSLFLDENFLGQTPFFDEQIQVGEYTLKLVLNGQNETVWQTKLKISKRALTVVEYEAGATPETSSSKILELEKLPNKEAVELSLSTLPDNVVVKLDGELKGFSPMLFEDVEAGDHTLTLEAPGYKTKTINLKTNEGHHLRVVANLARDPELTLRNDQSEALPGASESAQVAEGEPEYDVSDDEAAASPTPKPSVAPKAYEEVDGVVLGVSEKNEIDEPYVEILETGVGWLRVRSAPSGAGNNEVAKVEVGTYFPYVDESDNQEWVQIEYQPGKKGWVSAQYVKVAE